MTLGFINRQINVLWKYVRYLYANQGGGGEGTITSVNGDTGPDVILTAEDVGALDSVETDNTPAIVLSGDGTSGDPLEANFASTASSNLNVEFVASNGSLINGSVQAMSSDYGNSLQNKVSTIVAGDGVSVDDTDVKNPIISFTGGGTTLLEGVIYNDDVDDIDNGQTGIAIFEIEEGDNTPNNEAGSVVHFQRIVQDGMGEYQLFTSVNPGNPGVFIRWRIEQNTYSEWSLIATLADLEGFVNTVVAGNNVTVDDTDPANPIVSASGIQTITAGTAIVVDDSDPENIVISGNIPPPAAPIPVPEGIEGTATTLRGVTALNLAQIIDGRVEDKIVNASVMPIIYESATGTISISTGTIGQVLTTVEGPGGVGEAAAWVDPPSGGVVAWDDVTGKPTEFPPSAHTHPISEVTNLQTTLNTKLTANQGVSVPDTAQPAVGDQPTQQEFNDLLDELRALKASLQGGNIIA